MTNNIFETFESQTARPDNAYNETLTSNNLTLQALELWEQQSTISNGGLVARNPDFLNCDESPLQKGCEGPGKNPTEPPKNILEEPKGEGEKASHKWPPVDAAWGRPHGHGREGREGRAGREKGNEAVSNTLQEHKKDGERREGKQNSLPALEIIDRSGQDDTEKPRRRR